MDLYMLCDICDSLFQTLALVVHSRANKYSLLLLTSIGLMPGDSVNKKWTYMQKMDIHSKETKHLTKKQLISQNFKVQYKYNKQNTSYKTPKTKQNTEK
jgi:hypothetical protein